MTIERAIYIAKMCYTGEGCTLLRSEVQKYHKMCLKALYRIRENGEPLTLEELKVMKGEPVWATIIEPTVGTESGWALTYIGDGSAALQRWANKPLWYDEYGKTWIAFNRKVEV